MSSSLLWATVAQVGKMQNYAPLFIFVCVLAIVWQGTTCHSILRYLIQQDGNSLLVLLATGISFSVGMMGLTALGQGPAVHM